MAEVTVATANLGIGGAGIVERGVPEVFVMPGQATLKALATTTVVPQFSETLLKVLIGVIQRFRLLPAVSMYG